MPTRIITTAPGDESNQRKMFGDTIESLRKQCRESIYTATGGAHDGALMLAMSYLSDAQEVLATGQRMGFIGQGEKIDNIRQWMNVAKLFIGDQMGVPPPVGILIRVDETERDTILAALRVYQQSLALNGGLPNDDVEDIATNGGDHVSLTADEIDTLCERINVGAH